MPGVSYHNYGYHPITLQKALQPNLAKRKSLEQLKRMGGGGGGTSRMSSQTEQRRKKGNKVS